MGEEDILLLSERHICRARKAEFPKIYKYVFVSPAVSQWDPVPEPILLFFPEDMMHHIDAFRAFEKQHGDAEVLSAGAVLVCEEGVVQVSDYSSTLHVRSDDMDVHDIAYILRKKVLAG